MRSPEKKIAEDSHVNDCSKHDDRESTDVLHERTKDDGADCVDYSETDHHVSDLTDSQCTRDVSLINETTIKDSD